MLNLVSECVYISLRFGKRLEFKIVFLCVQDFFEFVYNLIQNIIMEILKNMIELMKMVYMICQDLNNSVDNLNFFGNKFLNFFIVCKFFKRRKYFYCYDFFVQYKNNSFQVIDIGCVNNLSIFYVVFVFVFEMLEREYGF